MTNYATLPFLLAFCLVTASGFAAPVPSGVYVSAGPTAAGRDSIVPAYADLDFIDGVLVRIGWDEIETAPGVYDWSALDRQFLLAEQMGLQISLGVTLGRNTPTWLGGLGAGFFDYELPEWLGGEEVSIPLPWDEVYLERWESFVGEFGERYNGEERLSLVHITHSSSNGFEMPLPFAGDAPDDWAAAGYSADLHAGAIERVIDAFDGAFPDELIDLEVHPVLGSDEVAQRVVDYANDRLDDRFGVFSAWWSENNADNVYPGAYELLQEQVDESYSTVQLVASATERPEAYGEAGLAGSLDRAYEDGVRFFEIWHNDVLNPELQPLLTSLHARLVPEPTGASVLLLAVLGGLVARRRRNA